MGTDRDLGEGGADEVCGIVGEVDTAGEEPADKEEKDGTHEEMNSLISVWLAEKVDVSDNASCAVMARQAGWSTEAWL